MPDSKPSILIVQPHLGVLTPLLEPEFTVWRLWEAPPLEATQKIAAMVVAGEFPLDEALAEHLPNLGLIASFTASYAGVDLVWARERGLKVSHAPGVNPDDVADQAIALMLAAWRGLVEGDATVRAGRWRPTIKRLSPSLAGRRLGLAGVGPVAEAVGRRAEPFGLSVAWWGPEGADAPWPRAESLVALAEESDILVLCEAAEGLFVDRAALEALGPQGLFVNVAGGDLADEDALIAALRGERLGMAALDVFAVEPTPAARWADVPNVVLSPHAAGATSGAIPKMVALTRENLRRFFAGEPLANPVVS